MALMKIGFILFTVIVKNAFNDSVIPKGAPQVAICFVLSCKERSDFKLTSKELNDGFSQTM